ncbi:MAG: DUF4981 domain-containing protein [Clostridiales bacterium]|nr:DUF4981 domain-containing protein [Clostridiales bacterium]
MTPLPSQGYFYPYDSIDELYTEKQPPEFGRLNSLWRLDLPSWRFYHAKLTEDIPQGWTDPEFDDSSWDLMDVPSVWQMQGYGYPSELRYEKNALLSQKTSRLQQRLADEAGKDNTNDFGLYRVWVNLPAQFVHRYVYFVTDGIVGHYIISVNGHHAASSRSTFATTKILLTDHLHEGPNLITIAVRRFDIRMQNGKPRKDVHAQGAFGFSGLFRLPYLVAESNVEVSSVRLTSSFLTDTLAKDVVPKTAMINSLYHSDSDDQSTERQREILSDAESRRDAELKVEVELYNHLPYDMQVTVYCRLMEARDEYDLYNLPEHRLTQRKELTDIIPKEGVKLVGTEFYAKLVLPWTDQTPNLYDLIIEVRDNQDQVICVKKQRFGFRSLSYQDGIFNINDVAVPIHGVKYYEFDPENGISVPLERFRQDILLMKSANINTVYVVHHPTDSRFFDLCDEYGMYVILQSAASILPQTVYSLFNHPCIIMWSMTGRKFDEGSYLDVKSRIKGFDEYRPLYCEIDKSGRVTDIPPFPNKAGMFFGEWCDLCVNRRYLKSRLKEDKVLFESILARPRREEDEMDLKYIHQGDLVEYSEQVGVSIAQGIVDANRNPHPIFFEVKKQCEYIKIFSSADNPAHLNVNNVLQFAGTPPIELKWQILLGGIRLTGGSGLVPSIPPMGSKAMQFPFNVGAFLTPEWSNQYAKASDVYNQAVCKELLLDISMTLAEDTCYARAGYELAFYQQVLVDEVCDPSSDENWNPDGSGDSEIQIIDASALAGDLIIDDEKPSVKIKTSPAFIFAQTKHVRYGFSRQEGGLCSVMIDDQEYFDGLLEPSFYRAAANIDRADKSYVLSQTVFSHETDWRTIQGDIRFTGSFYEMDGEDFHLICKYESSGMKGPIKVHYRVKPDGTILSTIHFQPRFDLVRFGFRVPIDPRAHIGWYGRGNGESYIDRKESQRIGWFTSLDSALYHEYARPSENGGHTDTKYLLLQHDDIKGLRISKENMEPFSFSCLPYMPEDLDDYAHQELIRSDNRTHLYLDFYMKGVERSPDVLARRGLPKNAVYEETIEFAPKY